MRGWWKGMLPLLTGAALVSMAALSAAQAPNGEKVDAAGCFGCHEEVQTLWKGSSHVDLGCDTCHAGMPAHLKNPQEKPRTDLNPEVCGACHQNQYETFFQVNWNSPARQEKGVPEGRSPQQDKLLAPHGFTVEHNEPRSHPFMVADMLVVDRFSAGRYQFKERWGVTRPGKVWDVVEDTGRTLPATTKAGNPVCLQCKTSDLILKWKFLGDKDPGAKWDRTSDVDAMVKDVQNVMGCIHCHDPHAARSRIVRDALIEAVSREGINPYAPDPQKNAVEVVTFRDFRRIGLINEGGAGLVCGQCHVEYSCNPGITPEGEKIGFDDRRTNHFPWRNALDILEQYDTIGFRDFRHAVTGARLVKLQHPEFETFWGSVHERAGVKCIDCHMVPAKNGAGETFTSHLMVGPRERIEQVCLRCHPESTAEEALYQVDAVQNYTRGKMRKAEYHLELLIDTFEEAARQGVPEEALAAARKQHEIAHVLWEWWTAENSDGWHNPSLARESLAASEAAAKEGIKTLQDAMKAKTGAPVVR
ncbi:ammonia-forming cytochrome c nitrite reductase subunit c552 [Desulfuromonas sp. TF]|uniref:ammonia-forming cytochrome c nitrite reductase subunit c552 n=1 Tax=Desulfuromonas sp. TF TaxID=1232410 RepID=UPI00041C1A6E|nr:ammonia-forming cytochrome c nitrite reductase subunit c552 [Desulfuromonas sp. TF]